MKWKRTILFFTVLVGAIFISSCHTHPSGKKVTMVLALANNSRMNNADATTTMATLAARIQAVTGTLPQLTYDGDSGHISIVFYGAEYITKVKTRVHTKGRLQFFKAYSGADVFPLLRKANDTLARLLYANAPIQQKPSPGTDSLQANSQKLKERMLRKFPLLSILAVPATNGQVADRPLIGHVQVTDTPTLNKYFATPAVAACFPQHTHFVYGIDHEDIRPGIYFVQDSGYIESAVDSTWILTDNNTHLPTVGIRLQHRFWNNWQQLTSGNTGGYIAMVLDGVVYACPRVSAPITNGCIELWGSKTKTDAQALSALLLAKKLPALLRVVSCTIEK